MSSLAEIRAAHGVLAQRRPVLRVDGEELAGLLRACRSGSNGRRRFPFDRIVARIRLTNGNPVKVEVPVLRPDDADYVAIKTRIAVLRCCLKADAACLDQGQERSSSCVALAYVGANEKG